MVADKTINNVSSLIRLSPLIKVFHNTYNFIINYITSVLGVSDTYFVLDKIPHELYSSSYTIHSIIVNSSTSKMLKSCRKVLKQFSIFYLIDEEYGNL